MFLPSLLVALGGAMGSLGRYWATLFIVLRVDAGFPLATLVVNVVGSFVIGVLGSATFPIGPHLAGHSWRPLLMVGLCGGFTTFSSFSLQTLELLQAGLVTQAAANIGLSVALCLLFVAAGWWIGAHI